MIVNKIGRSENTLSKTNQNPKISFVTCEPLIIPQQKLIKITLHINLSFGINFDMLNLNSIHLIFFVFIFCFVVFVSSFSALPSSSFASSIIQYRLRSFEDPLAMNNKKPAEIDWNVRYAMKKKRFFHLSFGFSFVNQHSVHEWEMRRGYERCDE